MRASLKISKSMLLTDRQDHWDGPEMAAASLLLSTVPQLYCSTENVDVRYNPTTYCTKVASSPGNAELLRPEALGQSAAMIPKFGW